MGSLPAATQCDTASGISLPCHDHGYPAAMSVQETPSAEYVVLLDDARQPVGTMLKSSVHDTETPLHLAFSVYVFRTDGRFLATRRATAKPTWGGVWTNSCCGHPKPEERPAEAAHRRLAEELGLVPLTLELALPDFTYRAVSPEGLVEHEVCPVFVAVVDTDPLPAPSEVAEWTWVTWSDYRTLASRAPWALSPWSVSQTALLPEDLGNQTLGR
ncbi:isopentenyl-diphosphate Delta-isomerase [soil metagenome]